MGSVAAAQRVPEGELLREGKLVQGLSVTAAVFNNLPSLLSTHSAAQVNPKHKEILLSQSPNRFFCHASL